MFTIHQIENIHAKVKGGADFPGYIQELIKLGVVSYSIYVHDGHIDYYGDENYHISSSTKHYPILIIAEKSDLERLKHALAIHQQGQTNYLTFCKHSAAAGVKKWIVNLADMQCVYFDNNEDVILVERVLIPLSEE